MNYTESLAGIINLVVVVGGVLAAVSFFIAQFRSGRANYEQKVLDTMKELLAARDVKINDLANDNQAMVTRIAGLEGQVQLLTQTNGDFSKIMREALTIFFEKHPERAVEISKQII